MRAIATWCVAHRRLVLAGCTSRQSAYPAALLGGLASPSCLPRQGCGPGRWFGALYRCRLPPRVRATDAAHDGPSPEEREAADLVPLPLASALGTNLSILPNPMTADEATDQVETWLAAPAAVVVQPTPRHASLLRGLLRDTGTAGNLTTDAHLAALSLEHGAEVVSYDRDFARFPGVKHRLPG